MMFWRMFDVESTAFAKQTLELHTGVEIFTFNYGTGERYLRQKGFFPV